MYTTDKESLVLFDNEEKNKSRWRYIKVMSRPYRPSNDFVTIYWFCLCIVRFNVLVQYEHLLIKMILTKNY